jgi:hypothetical protein
MFTVVPETMTSGTLPSAITCADAWIVSEPTASTAAEEPSPCWAAWNEYGRPPLAEGVMQSTVSLSVSMLQGPMIATSLDCERSGIGTFEGLYGKLTGPPLDEELDDELPPDDDPEELLPDALLGAPPSSCEVSVRTHPAPTREPSVQQSGIAMSKLLMTIALAYTCLAAPPIRQSVARLDDLTCTPQ